jgi:predicted transposase/invertase (TIGR01784 family)
MIFLQMPLFDMQEADLQTKKDKWLYFLKNLESFDDIPAILREPVFEQAFRTAEWVKYSPSMQEAYRESQKAYWDNVNTLNYALEEAREEARTEEKREIASSLKQEGVNISLIARTTGLSEEDIERL